MSAADHKPLANPVPLLPSSDEEDDDEEEEEEEEEGEEEFHHDDNDSEDGDGGYEQGDNDDANDDEAQEHTYSEPSSLGPPSPPPPSLDQSPTMPTAKWARCALSQFGEILRIYLKFALLAIIIYSAAVWYALNYGDMESADSKSVVRNDLSDKDTCPAALAA